MSWHKLKLRHLGSYSVFNPVEFFLEDYDYQLSCAYVHASNSFKALELRFDSIRLGNYAYACKEWINILCRYAFNEKAFRWSCDIFAYLNRERCSAKFDYSTLRNLTRGAGEMFLLACRAAYFLIEGGCSSAAEIRHQLFRYEEEMVVWQRNNPKCLSIVCNNGWKRSEYFRYLDSLSQYDWSSPENPSKKRPPVGLF